MRVLMFGVGTSSFIHRQIQALREQHIDVDNFRLPENRFWRAGYRQLPFLSRLPLVVSQLKSADLYHFQWPSTLIQYGHLRSIVPRPTVLSIRGRQITIRPYMQDAGGYVQQLVPALASCDGYHCVSGAIEREAEQFGLVRNQSRVIYTPIDTGFFTPKPKSYERESIEILMVGGLIWRKGYEYALVALKTLVDAGYPVSLTIVGDGEHLECIEFTVHDLGLEQCVNLAGKCSPSEVVRLLQDADLFLHTALSEGIANSVVEAMACGLPVVCTNLAGMREAIEDGVEGLLVPSRDSHAIAIAVKSLLDSPELRNKMGEAARQRVERQFTITQHAQSLISLYGASIKHYEMKVKAANTRMILKS